VRGSAALRAVAIAGGSAGAQAAAPTHRRGGDNRGLSGRRHDTPRGVISRPSSSTATRATSRMLGGGLSRGHFEGPSAASADEWIRLRHSGEEPRPGGRAAAPRRRLHPVSMAWLLQVRPPAADAVGVVGLLPRQPHRSRLGADAESRRGVDSRLDAGGHLDAYPNDGSRCDRPGERKDLETRGGRGQFVRAAGRAA
jgi:hypothetical protein